MKKKMNGKKREGFWHELYVDMVYLLQMRRIIRKYTQEDLSFLLGYPLNKLAKIESLKYVKAEYMMGDFIRLAQLYETNANEFMQNENQGHNMIQTQTLKHEDNDRIYYKTFIVDTNGNENLLYQLMELKPKRLIHPDKEQIIKEDEIDAVMMQLENLLAQGFFDEPREPIEIFFECKKAVYEKGKPGHIQMLLEAWVKANSLRRFTNDYRFYYEKI